jgi:hypothetical protein
MLEAKFLGDDQGDASATPVPRFSTAPRAFLNFTHRKLLRMPACTYAQVREISCYYSVRA